MSQQPNYYINKIEKLEDAIQKTQGEVMMLQRVIIAIAVAVFGISSPIASGLLGSGDTVNASPVTEDISH